ncbi:DUF4861 domain-containing protein [Bacteroidia bacterium]|nr:DUF4861 domain-containing protein [Bacteroidia bacterium]
MEYFIMRNTFILLIFTVLFTSCAQQRKITIVVTNDTEVARSNETVSISWGQLLDNDPKLMDRNVVVADAKGYEVTSQIIREGTKDPKGLIFQVTIPALSTVQYTLKQRRPMVYPAHVFGRLVPERKDDFAWENDKVVYRVFGPAAEQEGEICNGIDVWVKSTDKLVINDWYRRGDFDKDRGDGFDGYEVGRTLGGGALAPYVNGRIYLGNNFSTSEILDQGPLRLAFKLEYEPFHTESYEVTETRTISLDAHAYLTKIEDVYENAPKGMLVAAGIVTRPTPGDMWKDLERGISAYWEPENNSNDTDNGHIGVGVIIPDGSREIVEKEGHLLNIAKYTKDKPFTYYIGSAWSKAGVRTPEDWSNILILEHSKLDNPLLTEIRLEVVPSFSERMKKIKDKIVAWWDKK